MVEVALKVERRKERSKGRRKGVVGEVMGENEDGVILLTLRSQQPTQILGRCQSSCSSAPWPCR